MDSLIAYIIFLSLGFLTGFYFKRQIERIRQKRSETRSETQKEPAKINLSGLYKIADDIDDFFQETAHPKDLLELPDFNRGVELFNRLNITDDDLLDYCTGDNNKISCMAFEAFNNRQIGQNKIEQALFKAPERSVLLVGESGVGKSSILTPLVRKLENRGWKIFEAGATEILAGQVYIGELERIKSE